jgi:hypothetical protein
MHMYRQINRCAYLLFALVLLITAACSTSSPLNSEPVYGINILWYYNGSDSNAQVLAKANSTFTYVKELGADAVAINFPFYMATSQADSVYGGSATPNPGQIRIVAMSAKKFGLRIVLRPLLDEQSFGVGSGRTTLDPSNPSQWFTSYEQFLRPYLVMAQAIGIQQFSIGAEFTSLENGSRWDTLAVQARQVFHGQLVYANNWYQLQHNTAGSVADLQGLDAYPPFNLSDTASVQEIVNAWNSWLNSIPSSVRVDTLLLTEVGIPAQSGAYQKPYDSGASTSPIDPTIQQRWFAAACQIMRTRHMPGIYYWAVNLGQVPRGFDAANAPPYSFVKQGEESIQACFEGLSAFEADTAGG